MNKMEETVSMFVVCEPGKSTRQQNIQGEKNARKQQEKN
jgi:hypothetical protein